MHASRKIISFRQQLKDKMNIFINKLFDIDLDRYMITIINLLKNDVSKSS